MGSGKNSQDYNVLVSGGSIAGLTLTYWLHHYGFNVTLIERNDGLRLGGQNIDVKGPGWEVMQKMDLEKKLKAAHTTEKGIRFVKKDNTIAGEFPANNALSMTQEIEILRGDFVEILFEKVKDKAAFRFNTHITALQNDHTGTEVTFNNNQKEKFDLVLIAEGIGSSTRNLVFGSTVKFKYTGIYSSYFTMKKAATDNHWARWHNAVGAVVFLIRPDNHGTTRACIFFRSPERGYEKLSVGEQKDLLITKIKNVGWEADRIVDAIRESDDLYVERVSQVKMPTFYNERVAVVGDAAYCVTPLAGKGTDLAIAGAYILAGELAKNSNYTEAFQNYQDLVKPYATSVQKLPPGVPRLAYPSSKMGVVVLNGFFSLASSKFAKFLTNLFGGSKSKTKSDFQLPTY